MSQCTISSRKHLYTDKGFINLCVHHPQHNLYVFRLCFRETAGTLSITSCQRTAAWNESRPYRQLLTRYILGFNIESCVYRLFGCDRALMLQSYMWNVCPDLWVLLQSFDYYLCGCMHPIACFSPVDMFILDRVWSGNKRIRCLTLGESHRRCYGEILILRVQFDSGRFKAFCRPFALWF